MSPYGSLLCVPSSRHYGYTREEKAPGNLGEEGYGSGRSIGWKKGATELGGVSRNIPNVSFFNAIYKGSHSAEFKKYDSTCSEDSGAYSYFLLFRAAYGGSQARGRIGATAASLHHIHSNIGSEPHL